MPNRIIKESIHTSDSLNQCTDFQFRLWVNLIVYVDDYGRGDARAAVIRGTCFPLRENVTNKQIDDGLRVLASIGLIVLYEVDGKPYLCLPKWDAHQTVRNKRSKFPAPDDGVPLTDNTCKQMKANASKCPRNPIQSESLSESERQSESESEEAAPPRPSVDYQRIVDLYNTICVSFPRVKNLSDARRKAIAARLKTYDYRDFEELFRKSERSDFLKGKNDRDWSADFDWLIKDANMAKVLDGKYDSKDVPEDPDVYDPSTYDAGSAERQELLDRYIHGEIMTEDEMRIIFGEDE